ncbi:hypothetical protein ERX46_13155 [Brumimicrobium glaciale]|uniref:Lipocalin-like domain-containing protein n=1 Tax=Brumimicrobium glaciale TaxID=200475 RepID=A0A4Q4KI65_9FLAO|nr:hypothetical protein [Brumimicrobium glaciale]RYM32993.1 hypothetical protein ERX46_13155 [Brumimicrobium glaciale]
MKRLLFILLALFVLFSCSKEKKIERNLWKNGGKWDIVKYEEIVTSTWPANEKNEVNENIGILQFEKDGTGWMLDSDGYDAQKLNFKYTNSETELILDFYEFESTRTYDLDWEENSFTLTQSGTHTYTPGGSTEEITDHRLYRHTCKKE